MQKLKEDYDACHAIYEYIEKTMDEHLSSGHYALLLNLLPYFEQPKNYPAFHISADTNRIFVMLQFLRLELKYGKSPFLSTVHNYQEFMARYIQTVFAIRRLEFSLSDESVEEAASYLRSIPLSVYAAIMLIDREYFENYGVICQSLYNCMEQKWSQEDKILFLTFFMQKEPSLASDIQLIISTLKNGAEENIAPEDESHD